jgi:hypothetical protein
MDFKELYLIDSEIRRSSDGKCFNILDYTDDYFYREYVN